jgi:hypothetical protein
MDLDEVIILILAAASLGGLLGLRWHSRRKRPGGNPVQGEERQTETGLSRK